MKQIITTVLILGLSFGAKGQTWEADIDHSSLSFSVSHMVVSEVIGRFDDFEVTLVAKGDEFENAQISFEAKVESINTSNSDRDEHLKSSDFFDTDKYPVMRFKGKNFKKVSGKKYTLIGDLTMHGITKEVSLEVTFNGVIGTDDRDKKAGFKIKGNIDRYDYGLKYNSILDVGGLAIGREVEIEVRLEMIRQERE